jgi:hypothetical protein
MELNIKVHLEETGCEDGRQCGTASELSGIM